MSAPYFVAIGPAPAHPPMVGHDDYVSRAALARKGWTVTADRPTYYAAEAAWREVDALPTVERWWAALWQHRAQEVE